MSGSQSVPIISEMDYSDVYLNVLLTDVNNDEVNPLRHFPIGSPWSFKIGRGSQNEDTMNPHASNSWFGSRVMSREHAEVTVDQSTREFYISDLSSMHGTYMYGKRLRAGETTKIYPGDVVTFGTDVVRGEHTYRPLQLKFEFEWSDGTAQSGPPTAGYHPTPASNYVDDIVSLDEEVTFIGGSSAHKHGVSSLNKTRTFSVPDSDDSDSESDMDENEHSSPITFDEDDIAVVSTFGPFVTATADNNQKDPSVLVKSPEQGQSQVIVIDDEQAPVRNDYRSVNMSKIFEELKEPDVYVTTTSLGDYDVEDDDYENKENDVDFDSEAAQYHKHDSQDEDEDDDEEIDVDDTEISDDELDELDEPSHESNIQVAEFLQPAFNTVIQESYVAPLNDENNMTLPPIVFTQSSEISITNETSTTTEQGHDTAHQLPQGTGRVSIHNIINDVDVPSEPRLKRKADVLIDHIHDSIKSEIVPTSASGSDLPSVVRSEIKSETGSEQPPRKLIKIETAQYKESSRSKTFLKYTATAFAGVAVGAVTAVFGLAALPADYFI